MENYQTNYSGLFKSKHFTKPIILLTVVTPKFKINNNFFKYINYSFKDFTKMSPIFDNVDISKLICNCSIYCILIKQMRNLKLEQWKYIGNKI